MNGRDRSKQTKVTTVNARQQFSDIVNWSAYGKERIVLTRSGKEVVALVPIEDLNLLEELEDRLDIEAARKALMKDFCQFLIDWFCCGQRDF
jgi:prevent-host-death family protein